MRTVFVPGAPAPQGSKRHVGRGILIESSKNVGPWRERVALAAHSHAPGLVSGPVTVRLQFVMPRPKSAPKRSTPPAVKRPDVDKLARAVLDAITDVWIEDDSHVTHLTATKRLAEIGEEPGVHITVGAPHCWVCRKDNPPPMPAGCGPQCLDPEDGEQ